MQWTSLCWNFLLLCLFRSRNLSFWWGFSNFIYLFIYFVYCFLFLLSFFWYIAVVFYQLFSFLFFFSHCLSGADKFKYLVLASKMMVSWMNEQITEFLFVWLLFCCCCWKNSEIKTDDFPVVHWICIGN